MSVPAQSSMIYASKFKRRQCKKVGKAKARQNTASPSWSARGTASSVPVETVAG